MKADSGIEAIDGWKFKEMIKDAFHNAGSMTHVCYFFKDMVHNLPFKESFPSIPSVSKVTL